MDTGLSRRLRPLNVVVTKSTFARGQAFGGVGSGNTTTGLGQSAPVVFVSGIAQGQCSQSKPTVESGRNTVTVRCTPTATAIAPGPNGANVVVDTRLKLYPDDESERIAGDSPGMGFAGYTFVQALDSFRRTTQHTRP